MNTISDIKPSGLHIIINGTMGDNDWYVSCVTITIIAEGESIWYRFDEGYWTPYTVPLRVCEDGEYIIYAYSIDTSGNQTNAQEEFKIDQTDPTIIDLFAEKIGDNNTYRFTADVFDKTSGINRVEFYVDDKYLGTVTEWPYTWIINFTTTFLGFGIKGLIFNPKTTGENISFFAIIAGGHYIFSDYPIIQVIVYDNAGNWNINPQPSPQSGFNYHFYIFTRLTFSNNYSGTIGKFFINAIFEDGPL